MGNCAENTVKNMNITREEQDAYAIESYRRAAEAWKSGAFEKEIAPITIKARGGETIFKEDEEVKNIKLDKVPGLRPVFDKNGTVTAANASSIKCARSFSVC
jgi:acetyl-CoA C-acetyltransferase